MICKRCGAESPDGSKVCMMCGTPFSGPTICPNCGASVDAQAVFCPACGQKLGAPASYKGKAAPGKQKHTVRNILIAVAVVLVIFVLFGGNSDSSEKTPATTRSSSSASQKSDVDDKTASKEPEKEDKPSKKSDDVMIGSGTLGDSYIEIKGAELGTNYSDEPIIIITYTWTNNSDETTSAMVMTSEKAFQDGIEMDSSISARDVDFSNNMKDVRPGSSIDIKKAYVLASETSTVEFEITEWISFSDEMVKMDFDPAALG